MLASKRFCIVSAQYLPHVGGVENYVASFSKALLSRGYTVTIITSQAKNLPAYEDHENLEIFRLPTWQFMHGRFPVTHPSIKRSRLLKQIKKRQFIAMLVNVRFYFLSLLALKLAKKWRCPCVLLDHGSGHLTMQGKLATQFGEWFEHWITKREMRFNPRFAAVSKASAKWLEHFEIHTDFVLPNAVDLQEFRRLTELSPRDFIAEYAIPEGSTVISFVGRLTKEKGVLELCESFCKIAEEREDVYLFLAGDGYLRTTIEQFHPRIICLGVLSKAEVLHLNQQSDIFCLPSVSEGFCTAILEAAVCECYIVATAVGGAVDIIKTGAHGSLLRERDPKAIAAALKRAMDDPQKRRIGAELCRQEVEQNFTWGHTVDRFLENL